MLRILALCARALVESSAFDSIPTFRIQVSKLRRESILQVRGVPPNLSGGQLYCLAGSAELRKKKTTGSFVESTGRSSELRRQRVPSRLGCAKQALALRHAKKIAVTTESFRRPLLRTINLQCGP